MNGGDVQCQCGTVVHVPEVGQYLPCPKCRRMVTLDRPVVALAPDAVPMAEAAPGAESEAPGCPVCNAPMAPDAVQCLACGFRLGGRARPEEAGEGSGYGKYVLLATALLILGAAIGGMIYVKNKPPEPIKPDKSGYLYETTHQIQRAKKLTALLSVRQSIAAFQALNGRYPKSLDELANARMPAPAPPEGFAYDYDPKSGNIELINAPKPEPETPPAE